METRANTSAPRPVTAVPHYMRAKTDTLHHNRLTSQQQEQHRLSSLAEEEADAGTIASSAQQQPGVFHTTYEVSYTSPTRGLGHNRPATSPAQHATATYTRGGFGAGSTGGAPLPLPSHINPASLREKQKFLQFNSPPPPPSRPE